VGVVRECFAKSSAGGVVLVGRFGGQASHPTQMTWQGATNVRELSSVRNSCIGLGKGGDLVRGVGSLGTPFIDERGCLWFIGGSAGGGVLVERFGGRNMSPSCGVPKKVRHSGIKQCRNSYTGTVGLSYFGVGDWFAWKSRLMEAHPWRFGGWGIQKSSRAFSLTGIKASLQS
jgi:hypothetical protein